MKIRFECQHKNGDMVEVNIRSVVTWVELEREFQNFLRACGFVIPYDFEEEEPKNEK